jgi:ABC-type transport system substrate-binding protein
MGGYIFDKSYNLKKMFDKGNELSYYNKAVASEVDKLEQTRSAASQKAVYQKLKKELTKDVPYYCICYKTYSLTTVKSLKSSGTPVFFSPYRNVSTWSYKRTITPDTASDTYQSSKS